MHDFDALVHDWEQRWRESIQAWVTTQMAAADSGHGLDHVRRVVFNAIGLANAEKANISVVLPAAWLHDCVFVPKNSPQRSQASRLAADAAAIFLQSIDYPSAWIDAVYHCIQSHSFSANIPCETLEAKVVQDADRLEALGAIGLARCFMTGGAMRQRMLHPDDPFPVSRTPRDDEQSIDHFYAKLLGLHSTMQTDAGCKEARRRSTFLIAFLRQLASEIPCDPTACEQSLRAFPSISTVQQK
jgi:uncharacterized protein